MTLTQSQIDQYNHDGFIVLKDVFEVNEVASILKETSKVIIEDCPRRILEKNGSVRSFFAPEFSSGLFYNVTRSKRLVEASEQLIDDDVYIHQTKINTKQAMLGDWWEWHRDYTFWKLDDGMPHDNVVTAMIYLNDVNEFNGPLLLIPGTHKVADLAEESNSAANSSGEKDWFAEYQQSAFYMSALTANLKYTLSQSVVAYWAEKNGIVSVKAPAGTVIFFHGNLFHASSNNLSPWNRHTFLITYNSVHNSLLPRVQQRPDFIANRDFTPVKYADQDCLID